MSNELDDNNLNRFLATSTGDDVSVQTGNDLEGNPLLPSPGETIDSPWGQSVVGRIIPRYSTLAVRDASILSPDQGQLSYIVDVDEVQIWDGSTWDQLGDGVFLLLSGGTLTGQVLGIVGSAGTPGFGFVGHPDSGLYYSAGAGVRITDKGVFQAQFGDGQILAGTGSVATPAFSFQAYPSSGMYALTGGLVRITAGGNFQAQFGGGQIQAGEGTASAPAFSFQAQPTSGMYTLPGGLLRLTSGGVFQVEFAGQQIRASSGSVTKPAFSFQSQTSIGMYRAASNDIRVTVAGADKLRLTDQYFYSQPIYDATSGSSANVYVASNGLMWRSTSARRYKSNIQPAPQLADYPLEPVTFHHDGDDKDFIGFIADDIGDIDERAAIYDDDGQVENYDLRAVVAILAAKVNALEERVTELEAS